MNSSSRIQIIAQKECIILKNFRACRSLTDLKQLESHPLKQNPSLFKVRKHCKNVIYF